MTRCSHDENLKVVRRLYLYNVQIRSSVHQSHTHHKPRTTESSKRPCVHSHHHHTEEAAGPFPYIRESYVETPHALMEALGAHEHPSTLTGAAAGAIGALAAIRSVQNFQVGGAVHNIEGLGNVALAAAGGLTAFEMLSEAGEAHGHAHGHAEGHGFGLVGALEVAHGLAELTVGGMELRRPGRTGASVLRLIKGTSILAAQLVPSVAGLANFVALGSTIAGAVVDPLH